MNLYEVAAFNKVSGVIVLEPKAIAAKDENEVRVKAGQLLAEQDLTSLEVLVRPFCEG